MTNQPSTKVAAIREWSRQIHEEPDSPAAQRHREEIAQQRQSRESRLRRAAVDLSDAVDNAIATADEPTPVGLVEVVIEQIPPSQRDDAFRVALRVYIELRAYERQGQPGLVRTEDDPKVRENRLRRMAARQGLTLTKSRRRDQRAADYGMYWLADQDRCLVSPEQGINLDEVETYLT